MQTAKFVQMAMHMKLAADDKTMGWADLVQSMYRGMGIDRRSLIAEFLKRQIRYRLSQSQKHRSHRKKWDRLSISGLSLTLLP